MFNAPAIAAFTLAASSGGFAGLQSFLGRALLWRCSAAWYAFLIIGIPLIFIGGSAIRGNLFSEPFPFASLQALFVGLFVASIKGPMEEFGWRGFALPLLQRKVQSQKSFQTKGNLPMANKALHCRR